VTRWIIGSLIWLSVPAVIWGIIIFMIGGTDAVLGYLRIIGVVLVIALIGGGVSWIWKKLGGQIND